MRQLTEEEVEFEEAVVDDSELPEGTFATDDPEQDKRDEQDIRDRLARGDNSAWCVLAVHAQWEGFVGFASLGGFTFPEGNTEVQNQEYAREEFRDLRAQALDNLNEQLSLVASKLAELD